MGEDAEGIRRRWAAWAVDAMGGDEAAAVDAARAAVHAVEAGAGDAVAAVFGRMSRLPPTEADVAMLEQELRRVRRSRLGLAGQTLPESEMERQRAHYARLDGLLAGALVQARRHLQPAAPGTIRVHLACHVAVAAVLVGVAVLLAWLHAGVGASLGLACLAVAHAVYAQRWSLSWAPAACVVLTLLTIGRWFGLGSTAIGGELVGAAAVLTLIVAAVPAARAALWPVAAILLLLVSTLLPDVLWAHVALLAAATALGVAIAVRAGRPLWLVLPMLLGTVAGYWSVRLWLPAAGADVAAVAAATLWPVPPAVALAGLVVRSLAGRRWAVPLYAFAGVLAAAYLAMGALGPSALVWAAALAGDTVVAYAIAVRERWTAPAVVCLAAGSLATLGAVAALGAGPLPLPLAFSGLAVVLTAGQWLGRGARLWRELHVAAGLVVTAGAAVACLVSPAFWQSWSAAPLIAIVPLATFAALLLVESRIPPSRFLWYPAMLALSVGWLWVARLAGATNPEWYVLGPSLTVAVLAVRAHRDQHLPPHPLGLCRACAAFGCVLPLAVTAWLSLDGDAPLYGAVLLAQSAACLAAGFRFGNRALLVCGLLGTAATLFRGLGLLTLLLPPTAALAVAAALLTIAAVAAALARHPLADAWTRLSRTWQSGV